MTIYKVMFLYNRIKDKDFLLTKLAFIYIQTIKFILSFIKNSHISKQVWWKRQTLLPTGELCNFCRQGQATLMAVIVIPPASTGFTEFWPVIVTNLLPEVWKLSGTFRFWLTGADQIASHWVRSPPLLHPLVQQTMCRPDIIFDSILYTVLMSISHI